LVSTARIHSMFGTIRCSKCCSVEEIAARPPNLALQACHAGSNRSKRNWRGRARPTSHRGQGSCRGHRVARWPCPLGRCGSARRRGGPSCRAPSARRADLSCVTSPAVPPRAVRTHTLCPTQYRA
jgi:hypothetical protein